jgi:hypothetical protein
MKTGEKKKEDGKKGRKWDKKEIKRRIYLLECNAM